MKIIYLSPPHLTDEAMAYLQDAVTSNWIAPVGPHVDAFEHELSELLAVPHALTTTSGTAAIHLGLLALGVGRGDEVICPTFTFCATVNPIVYCGAVPVFIDSEEMSWNMDPSLLEEAVADRLKQGGRLPKAIIVVHLYGMPSRMDEIMHIAAKYGIPVLEDAAEALGSMYKNSRAGTLGDVGILSFNGNKIVTTSGGGALFTRNPEIAARARYLRQEAREPLPYYEHREVGYNYRMSNLLAALGRSQLKVLEERVDRKRFVFTFYREALADIEGIAFQEEGLDMASNRWLSAVVIRGERVDPERLRRNLEDNNIESRRLWKPMHLQPVFKGYSAYVNGLAEGLFVDGLCLPSGTSMTEEDLGRVVDVLRKAMA